MSPRGASDGAPAVPSIRIVVADDHEIVRDGLRALIETQPDLQVVGEAGNGQEAWLRTRELKPDVLILDVSMPGVGGAEAAERVAKECPEVRIVALTMHEERGYVARLLRGGATGYVLKRTASAELVRAIRAVAAGGVYVDPSLAGVLLGGQAQRPRHAGIAWQQERLARLTAREREVLKLVARGHTNKEIAAALEVSVKTVETHKSNAMTKLGLSSRAAVVRFALGEGWLSDVEG